jgi:hypothetical protein
LLSSSRGTIVLVCTAHCAVHTVHTVQCMRHCTALYCTTVAPCPEPVNAVGRGFNTARTTGPKPALPPGAVHYRVKYRCIQSKQKSSLAAPCCRAGLGWAGRRGGGARQRDRMCQISPCSSPFPGGGGALQQEPKPGAGRQPRTVRADENSADPGWINLRCWAPHRPSPINSSSSNRQSSSLNYSRALTHKRAFD